MITFLEELSLNAWPALQTVHYDGWILRFASGYTRRSNSVNPIYPCQIDIDQKIRFCEDIYRARKLPTVFKMTSAVHPGNLDEILAARGYRQDAPTCVQVLTLESRGVQVAQGVSLQEDLTAEWLAGFCRMNPAAEQNRETLRQILANLIPRHCFVSLEADGQMIACGLGVYQSETIGLFDIYTQESYRQHGYGGQIVHSILSWGKQNGAKKAYLQVMLDNTPALALYAKIGFVEKYPYWYRIAPGGG